jgi:hypothetical protein
MTRAGLVLLALAAPAVAETYVEAYGLGDAAPRPEESYAMPNGTEIRARLVDRQGRLVTVLQRKAPLFVEVSVIAVPDAVLGGPYSCSFEFASAAGETTELQPLQPCPPGAPLADGWVILGTPFRFYPEARDPRGTSGVNVGIHDAAAGRGATLTVTFDWQGGLF